MQERIVAQKRKMKADFEAGRIAKKGRLSTLWWHELGELYAIQEDAWIVDKRPRGKCAVSCSMNIAGINHLHERRRHVSRWQFSFKQPAAWYESGAAQRLHV